MQHGLLKIMLNLANDLSLYREISRRNRLVMMPRRHLSLARCRCDALILLRRRMGFITRPPGNQDIDLLYWSRSADLCVSKIEISYDVASSKVHPKPPTVTIWI